MRIKILIIELLIILCVAVILARLMPINITKFIPTHRLPSDPYYRDIADEIIAQKNEWERELGEVQGVQKTVDWINGKIMNPPLPLEIAEAIKEAEVDKWDPRGMSIHFSDENKITCHFCPKN